MDQILQQNINALLSKQNPHLAQFPTCISVYQNLIYNWLGFCLYDYFIVWGNIELNEVWSLFHRIQTKSLKLAVNICLTER
jgi:hypothetical protein